MAPTVRAVLFCHGVISQPSVTAEPGARCRAPPKTPPPPVAGGFTPNRRASQASVAGAIFQKPVGRASPRAAHTQGSRRLARTLAPPNFFGLPVLRTSPPSRPSRDPFLHLPPAPVNYCGQPVNILFWKISNHRLTSRQRSISILRGTGMKSLGIKFATAQPRNRATAQPR